ncbi:TPA: hypothetical protein LU109_003628 [Enterobacter hormaechei subsp. xiangfangensis]|nr:hypothetical protein [Enterobacter hormaechei subsp. xiangfangensis]
MFGENLTSFDQLIALVKQLINPGAGRTSFVVTAKGDEVRTAFKVVEASELIVSNNGDGTINPAYPAELQPRDRTRLSSKLQVNNIAKNIRPAQLGDSGMSSHGAPIIGPDNVVESGNGRTMGIIRAYGSGQGDAYRDYLITNAKLYGLSASKMKAMRQPVLVRIRLDDIDRVQFAKDSNISDLQEMAASEKAFVDADSISGDLLAQFNPGDSGDLLAKSNNAFIQGFMKSIGATAAAGLMTDDGRPTRQLVDRVQNAIFAKAYKNEKLVKLVSEEPDPELRNVLTALNVAAPAFVEMQYLSGEAHKSTVDELVDGITQADSLDQQAMDSLIEAINLVRRAKESGQHIQEVIAQQGLFEESTPEAKALALFIVSNNRSAKRMAAAFKALAGKINAELIHQQAAAGDMFGGGDVTLTDILQSVSDELERDFGEGASLGLFEAAAAPKSLYFPQATDVEDLIDLIGSTVYTTTDRLGKLVGRWLEKLLDNEITKSQYVSFVDSVLPKGSDERQNIEEGRDRDFIFGMTKSSYGNEPSGMGMPTLAGHILFGGEVMNIRELARVWKETDSSDEAAKKKAGTALFKAFNKMLDWTKMLNPPMEAWLYMATAKRMRTGDWQDLKDYVNNVAPRLTRETAPAAFASVRDAGTTLLNATSATKSARANLVSMAANEGPRMKSNPFAYKHSHLNYWTQTEWDRNVDALMTAVKNGKLMFGNAKNDGYFQPRRNLSANGKKLFDDAIHNALVPVSNRLNMAVMEVFDKTPVTDQQAEEFYQGIAIHPAVAFAYKQKHGAGMLEVDIKFAYKLAGGRLDTLTAIHPARKGERASASRVSKCIYLGADDARAVLVHEIGHHFEFSNMNMLHLAIQYLKSRARGKEGTARKLKTLCKGFNYRQDEKAILDDLSEPYIGKIYGESLDFSTCTEVFSMGFQYCHDLNAGAISIGNDDGLMEFVLGAIKGSHNEQY